MPSIAKVRYHSSSFEINEPNSNWNLVILVQHPDNIDRVTKENEGKKKGEIKKLLSAEWKEADKETQEKYKKLAKKEKEALAGSDDEKSTKRKRETKSSDKSKKTKTDKEGTTKRPPTAYALYCKAKRPEVKAADSDASNSEITKKLAAMWKEASDAEKKPFNEEAAKLKTASGSKPAAKKAAPKKKKDEESEEEESGSGEEESGSDEDEDDE